MIPEKTPWMLELDELSRHRELESYHFPFRGHIDFRGFTQDDYDNFPGGVWCHTGDARRAKWFGGKALADAAEAKLIELGYAVQRVPHERNGWVNLLFTPKSVPADYQANPMIAIESEKV